MKRNIVDFPERGLIEDEAWEWVVKFEGDSSPSDEDVQALNEWMGRSALHKQALRDIARDWNDMDLLGALIVPNDQKNKQEGFYWSGALLWILSPLLFLFTLSVQCAQQFSRAMKSRIIMTSLATGSCAIFLAILLIYQLPGRTVYSTAVGQQSTYQLADGSILQLNTNSEVEVNYSESARRINLHKGEAHFDVVSDKTRPFEVYAGSHMVRAVGTAFSVYLEELDVKLTVTEGKVEVGYVQPVYFQGEGEGQEIIQDTQPPPAREKIVNPSTPAGSGQAAGIIGSLTAGQSVVIPLGKSSVLEEYTEHEKSTIKRRLAWLEGQLIFAGEPLKDVLKEVGRYTPIYIELIDPKIANIQIGGNFLVGETEALFDILEIGFGLQVSRVNDLHVQISEK